MNLIGLIIGVALIAVVGGGYIVMNSNDAGMMDKSSVDTNMPETPAEAIDAAEEAKRMMEEKDAMAQNMMDDSMAQDESMMKNDDAMMPKDDGAMMKKDEMMDDGAMMKKGSYEAYASEKLAMANSGDVVLFFRASWCPSCKALDANIKANESAIPEDLTILDVNYDTATELKKKYGVTYQHTLVQVDASGNQIAKWSGSQTLADLASKVQ